MFSTNHRHEGIVALSIRRTGEADEEVTESDLAMQLLKFLGNGENLLVWSACKSVGEV